MSGFGQTLVGHSRLGRYRSLAPQDEEGSGLRGSEASDFRRRNPTTSPHPEVRGWERSERPSLEGRTTLAQGIGNVQKAA